MKNRLTHRWSIAPLVRVALPLIVGISISNWLHSAPTMVLLLAIASSFSLVLLHLKSWNEEYRKRIYHGILINSVALMCGWLLGAASLSTSSPHHFFQNTGEGLLVEIVSEPKVKGEIIRFEAGCCAFLEDNHLHKVDGKLMVSGYSNLLNDSQTGDLIWLKESPEPVTKPLNPHEFDYQAFLANRGITHQCFVNHRSDFVMAGSRVSILSWFSDVRTVLQSKIDELPTEDVGKSILSALLLGQKQSLERETNSDFAAAGAMHVLAVSGLHVGLVYLILFRVLSLLARVRNGNWWRAVLIIILLWAYAGITGFSPSVLRAATMFSAIAVAQATSRRTNIYNTLAFSAVILLVINPRLIFEVGFQLSYLAVIGIVYLQPRIYAWFNPTNWLLDKAWQISSVSIAAQLATFPLGLYYFHIFPTYFLISNIVVIPLVTVILILGIAYLATCWIDWIGFVIGHLLSWAVEGLALAVKFISSIDGSQIQIGCFSEATLLLTYALIGTFLAYLSIKKAIWAQLALCAGIILTGYGCVRNEMTFAQREVVIYDVRGKSVIGIKRGAECWLLTDEDIGEKDLKYRISGDLDAHRIDRIHRIKLDSAYVIIKDDLLIANGVIQIGEKKFSGFSGTEDLASMLEKEEISDW